MDHRLIWWDAVIPRGKATNTRTPICIILYCQPDLLGTIAKYFESQRVILKTPPFYNPACRYSNPHHHILEQQYQLQQQQYRQQQQQQQQQMLQQRYGYQSYTQYNSYGYSSQLPARDPRQEQKDIEMLLASIPSDVPRLSKKKKKKALEKNKNAVIEIHDDDDDNNDDDAMAVGGEGETDDEDEDSGYVEGLTCHLMEHQIKGVSWMIDRENNESSNGGILADVSFFFFYGIIYTSGMSWLLLTLFAAFYYYSFV